MANKRIEFTEQHDAMIRRAYAPGKTGGCELIAKRLGISTGSVSRRASFLGCVRKVKKTHRAWQPEEICIAEANAHKELPAINIAIIKAGYPSRSLESIRKQINKIGIYRREAKVDAGIYNQSELSRLMGMVQKTIQAHITAGRLKATKRQGITQTEYTIKAADVRKFIVDYAPNVDIASCDKYWLIDILTGAIK